MNGDSDGDGMAEDGAGCSTIGRRAHGLEPDPISSVEDVFINCVRPDDSRLSPAHLVPRLVPVRLDIDSLWCRWRDEGGWL